MRILGGVPHFGVAFLVLAIHSAAGVPAAEFDFIIRSDSSVRLATVLETVRPLLEARMFNNPRLVCVGWPADEQKTWVGEIPRIGSTRFCSSEEEGLVFAEILERSSADYILVVHDRFRMVDAPTKYDWMDLIFSGAVDSNRGEALCLHYAGEPGQHPEARILPTISGATILSRKQLKDATVLFEKRFARTGVQFAETLNYILRSYFCASEHPNLDKTAQFSACFSEIDSSSLVPFRSLSVTIQKAREYLEIAKDVSPTVKSFTAFVTKGGGIRIAEIVDEEVEFVSSDLFAVEVTSDDQATGHSVSSSVSPDESLLSASETRDTSEEAPFVADIVVIDCRDPKKWEDRAACELFVDRLVACPSQIYCFRVKIAAIGIFSSVLESRGYEILASNFILPTGFTDGMIIVRPPVAGNTRVSSN